MYKTQIGSALRANLITITVIIILFAFAISMLPRGYSDDISRIGQGSNIVVLAHNKNSAHSMKLMEMLNEIRSDYAGKIRFLVIDVETEKGKNFIRDHQVNDSVLVLFDGDGTQLMVLDDIGEEQDLRMTLDSAFRL